MRPATGAPPPDSIPRLPALAPARVTVMPMLRRLRRRSGWGWSGGSARQSKPEEPKLVQGAEEGITSIAMPGSAHDGNKTGRSRSSPAQLPAQCPPQPPPIQAQAPSPGAGLLLLRRLQRLVLVPHLGATAVPGALPLLLPSMPAVHHSGGGNVGFWCHVLFQGRLLGCPSTGAACAHPTSPVLHTHLDPGAASSIKLSSTAGGLPAGDIT